MKNQELFKEAIADAKAVRDAALANAKKSLEETFAPKVESMLDKKLAELEEKELAEAEETNESSDPLEEELESVLKELGMSEETEVNESDELEESEIEESEDINEEEGEEPSGDEEIEASADLEVDAEAGAEGESQDVAELSVDEFTELIRNVVQDVISGGGSEEPSLDDAGMDDPSMGGEEDMAAAGGEEEIDLDELIAELDGDVNESEDLDESEETNESEDVSETTDNLKEAKQWYDKKVKGGKKVKMKEVKKGVDESKAWYMAKKAKKGSAPKIKEAAAKPINKLNESKSQKELAEAIKVIKVLKETLGSTNLLNAKLLYTNKIFKAKSLTENQKVKVVAAFDKAKTTKEAKMIFESLSETLSAKKKTTNVLKENFGFASKPISTAGKKPSEIIVEDAAVARMKKLAGLS